MQKEKGQTLLEVLVALSVIVFIIAAITTAVIVSLSSAQYAKNQKTATSLAQEGLDVIRGFHDNEPTQYNSLFSKNSQSQLRCGIYNDNSNACSPTPTPTPTPTSTSTGDVSSIDSGIVAPIEEEACLGEDDLSPLLKPSCPTTSVTPNINCTNSDSITVGNTIFYREINIDERRACNECNPTPTPSPNPTPSYKVTVTVLWTDGKCTSTSYCHNVQLISCLSGVPSPTQTP